MAYPGSATYRATTRPEILPQSTSSNTTNPDVIPGPDSASPLPREQAEVTAAETIATAGKPGNFSGQTPAFYDIDTTTPEPATPWETGQYIVCSGGEWVYWDGSVWKTGEAP